MRILLSAYACEPDKGSEAAVGWQWAIHLAKQGYAVWVLTRQNNRPGIEQALQQMPALPNLHFLYYDLPDWIRHWKRGQKGIQLYYRLWQWRAWRVAQHIHQQQPFDWLHHVTFVDVRTYSHMERLGVPLIVGPVAGGDTIPWRLRFSLGWCGFFLELTRDVANLLTVRYSPMQQRFFAKAHRIYVTSEETKRLISPKHWSKVYVKLAIGHDFEPVTKNMALERKPCPEPPNRVLYVGRFLYLKGMHLGLRAFHRLLQVNPNARLTLVGDGPEKQRWFQLIDQLGLSEHVDYIPWINRDLLQAIYAEHDIMLFPSLRDSGGQVLLEAMAFGLPVVCLDLGGPGLIADSTCGHVIPVRGVSEATVVESISQALIRLTQDPQHWEALSSGALRRVEAFRWERLVQAVYADLHAFAPHPEQMVP